MTLLTRSAFLAAVCGAALAFTTAGCGSLSDSSESSSAFISSPITSLSRSSSPEIDYREDVRDFTAAHIQAGGNVENLRSGLGDVAAKHGISDWESNESTYRGIGQGLAKAGYSQVQADAFATVLTQSEQQLRWIQDGFAGK
jgi:hypothetical protein